MKNFDYIIQDMSFLIVSFLSVSLSKLFLCVPAAPASGSHSTPHPLLAASFDTHPPLSISSGEKENNHDNDQVRVHLEIEFDFYNNASGDAFVDDQNRPLVMKGPLYSLNIAPKNSSMQHATSNGAGCPTIADALHYFVNNVSQDILMRKTGCASISEARKTLGKEFEKNLCQILVDADSVSTSGAKRLDINDMSSARLENAIRHAADQIISAEATATSLGMAISGANNFVNTLSFDQEHADTTTRSLRIPLRVLWRSIPPEASAAALLDNFFGLLEKNEREDFHPRDVQHKEDLHLQRFLRERSGTATEHTAWFLPIGDLGRNAFFHEQFQFPSLVRAKEHDEMIQKMHVEGRQRQSVKDLHPADEHLNWWQRTFCLWSPCCDRNEKDPGRSGFHDDLRLNKAKVSEIEEMQIAIFTRRNRE